MPENSYIIKANGLIDDLGTSTGGAPDEKVKVTVADTTIDYLVNKLVAGTYISLTTQNPGGNENILINTNGGDSATIVYAPTTVADWDGSADPGNVDDALDQLAERVTDLEGSTNNASTIIYTPSVLADWNSSTDPGEVDDALNQLAERIKDIELTSGGSPDSSTVTYTPALNSNWNSSTDPGDVDNALDQLASRVKAIETTPPNASVIPYSPSTLADWDSSTDPGDVDDALNQLAERMKDLEVAGASPIVAASATDTTPDYLFTKITAGSRMTITKTSPGGNEHVQFTADIQDASIATYTPGNLANWNSSADPGQVNDALNQLADRVKTLEVGSGPTPDASAITYTPTTVGDWSGGTDPGNLDDALDQLAGRSKDLEDEQGLSYVEATDATLGYLEDKILAGTGISINVTGSTDKVMTISASGGGGGSGGDDAEEMAWNNVGFNGTINANRLADSQTTTTPTSVYTVGTGDATRITSILFYNNSSVTENLTVDLDVGGDKMAIVAQKMPLGSTYEWVPEHPLIMHATDQLFIDSQPNGGVEFWINGGEKTQPASGVRPMVFFAGYPDDSGSQVLYTVPSGKKAIITYMSAYMNTDRNENGTNFDIVGVGDNYHTLYSICMKYEEMQYWFPKLILQDGDTIRGYSEVAGDIEFVMCGLESEL